MLSKKKILLWVRRRLNLREIRAIYMDAKKLFKVQQAFLLTSVQQNLNLRSYWGSKIGNDIIKKSMSVNRFEQIKRILHFNNNETILSRNEPCHDRLHKIGIFIAKLIEISGSTV